MSGLTEQRGNGVDPGLAVDRFLETRRTELNELIGTLVSIDSQVPPYADERAIVDYLKSEVARRGLGTTEVIGKDPQRPNLLVRIAGSGDGPSLMFNGHVDTKPPGDARDQWRSDPLTPHLSDGRMYGLGTSDMKGAVAAMIMAMTALHDLGIRLGGDVVLALVADEEAGAVFGSRFVAEQLGWIDACLIGEPSGIEDDWDGIHLVSRGVVGFRIIVRGTQMHSSLSRQLPSVNASVKAAELMVRMQDELRFEHQPHALDGSGPTLNVGVIMSGGVGFGTYSGRAEFGCDLRTVPSMTQAGVASAIESWLAACRSADPELDVEFAFEPGIEWVPPAEISASHPLVDAARGATAEVLGRELPLVVFPGGTDAPWYSERGIQTIPSLGPGVLSRCHGPNEYVSLQAVFDAARMYARIAMAYCGVADVDDLRGASSAGSA